MEAPGYFALIAALTAAGRLETGITDSVSTQLPSKAKLADTELLLSLNSASYSFAFSLPHFTAVAPGNLVLKAVLTGPGRFFSFIFWEQLIVANETIKKANANNDFIKLFLVNLHADTE